MMDYFWEKIYLDFFIYATIFFDGFYPQKMFYFFYLSHFKECEDDLYISTQQIDGWADTLKTFYKNLIDDPFNFCK